MISQLIPSMLVKAKQKEKGGCLEDKGKPMPKERDLDFLGDHE